MFIKYQITCTLLLSLALVATINNPGQRAWADLPPSMQGHVLVEVDNCDQAKHISAQYNSQILMHVDGTPFYAFKTPIGLVDGQFASALASDSRIADVEPDSITSIDDLFTGVYHHFAFDKGPDPKGYVNQAAYKLTNAPNTVDAPDGNGVIVAVLDTGIDGMHRDLIHHHMRGFNAINPGAPPLDLADGLTNAAAGHGTMVAGIIAKIAPKARIMAVKVLNADGYGTLMSVMAGLHYAIKHGANVINMSFTSPYHSAALDKALEDAYNAGIILVAAAGNQASAVKEYPADSPCVISVASVEDDLKKSPYSNFGSNVQVVAPGSGIRSTFYDGGYADWSGTSFAAPFVSAEAALMVGVYPSSDAFAETWELTTITKPIDKYNPRYAGQLGNGLIDISLAVKVTTERLADSTRNH